MLTDYRVSMVVEDNLELNNVITEMLSEKYKVIAAYNGVQAIELLQKNEVNLVISDVMMPEMDGLTLCKMIKKT